MCDIQESIIINIFLTPYLQRWWMLNTSSQRDLQDGYHSPYPPDVRILEKNMILQIINETIDLLKTVTAEHFAGDFLQNCMRRFNFFFLSVFT